MIRDAALWEAVWDRLEQQFTLLAGEVRKCNPEMNWRCRRFSNEAFPFRGYASYSRNDPKEEDLVVFVNCFLSQCNLLISIDISRGDGRILANGPEAVLLVSAKSTQQLRHEMLDIIDKINSFIDECLKLVLQELC